MVFLFVNKGERMLTHNHNKEKMMRFLLVLILGLSISIACRVSPFNGPTQGDNENLSIQEGEPTLEIDDQEIEITTVLTPTLEQLVWKNNWLHFGVDSQFSSFNPNESEINNENVDGLVLLDGRGCEDGYFSVIGGTPALFQGQYIITYAGGFLEAGDPASGNLLWQFGEQAYAWAPPPVVSTDGIVYYLYVTADASSKLFAVDIETGQEIWQAATQFKTGFNFDAQVTVDEKNDLVYVLEGTFGDGRLFAVDRKTGEIAWFLGGSRTQDEKMTFVGTIVPMQADKLYIPAEVKMEHSRRLHMVRVDVLTQEVDLQYDISEELSLSWGVEWYGLCNDHVFETYQENSRQATFLVAHPLDHPEITWQMQIPAQSGRFACDTSKDILYVPTDESLLALDGATGTRIWEHSSISRIFTPTIANGVIYYISDTNMYALDQEDGQQLFRYPLGVGADPSTGVLVNDGLVIFSGSGGTCDLIVLGLE